MRLFVVAAVLACTAFSPAGAQSRDQSKKITIDLQQAEIANVIRLIGDVGNKNVVVGEEVKGKVTLKLKNVGWRQALNVSHVKVGTHGYHPFGHCRWHGAFRQFPAFVCW